MLRVTVPCENCGGAVSFGEARCGKCGVAVRRDAKDALHARLASSSEDYRDLQTQISSARSALLVASLMYLAVGLIAFLGLLRADTAISEDYAVARVAFLADIIVATVFLFLWWFARSRPATAMLLSAALWLILQLLLGLTLPTLVWSALWFKGVVAILMLRGIIAAFRARVFLRRLREAAQQAVEAGGRAS